MPTGGPSHSAGAGSGGQVPWELIQRLQSSGLRLNAAHQNIISDFVGGMSHKYSRLFRAFQGAWEYQESFVYYNSAQYKPRPAKERIDPRKFYTF